MLALFCLMATACLALPGTAWGGGKTIDRDTVLAEADTENGKEIYLHGKRLGGARIAFNGGPHWLRTEEVGCVACHGKQGLGGETPNFCYVVAPPITYKYLAGDGYSVTERKNGSHPTYTMKGLKQAIVAGSRLDGSVLDYCMPRWRLTIQDFKDLLGYILTLDDEK